MWSGWGPCATAVCSTSETMEIPFVNSNSRALSLFQTLSLRQVRPTKVFQLPYEGHWASAGEMTGSGVLTVQNQYYRAPPLSLSFAKIRSDGHQLAVADEEGYCSVFNTRGQLPRETDCYSMSRNFRPKFWLAHTNAIFDVCWTKDDTHILTGSGDQTIRLWDIENQRGVGLMAGHTGSVKSICVHPTESDLFMSGSRDGCVAFWDLRCQSGLAQGLHGGTPKYAPVTKIKDAHKGVINSRKRKGYTRSVTAVLYLKDERVVATAGANDGVVKFWDTRKLRTPVAHTPSQRISPGTRMHGIAGLSQDPTGTRLIATCVDSKIYMYDVMRLEKGELKTFSGHTMGSFYIKASFSPDGSHILGGSTDHNAYLWKVDRPDDPPTLLRGHSGEVTAVDWCSLDHGKIATCSDDITVRVWNLREPRFSPKVMSKVSRTQHSFTEEYSSREERLLDMLRLEDSQHPSQTGLQIAEKYTRCVMLSLVEDSQLPLQALNTPSESTKDDADANCKRHSPHIDCQNLSPTTSFSESFVENLDDNTATSPDFKRIKYDIETTPRSKRKGVPSRALIKSAAKINKREPGEIGEDIPERTGKFLQSDTSDKEVSPPFKRTRVPFRDLNGTNQTKRCEVQGTKGTEGGPPRCSSENIFVNVASSMSRKCTLADWNSTPPISRTRVPLDFSRGASTERQLSEGLQESPVGQSEASPSSVLSPPSSIQKRRKTIKDYFSLQPQCSEPGGKATRRID